MYVKSVRPLILTASGEREVSLWLHVVHGPLQSGFDLVQLQLRGWKSQGPAQGTELKMQQTP